MSKPDKPAYANKFFPRTHVAYKCWNCSWENSITWPESFRYVGAKKSHECTRCDYMVHAEIVGTDEYTQAPRVRIHFETLMWISPDERTTP